MYEIIGFVRFFLRAHKVNYPLTDISQFLCAFVQIIACILSERENVLFANITIILYVIILKRTKINLR